MHKKLGPLEAWQWAAILGGLILTYLFYEHEKASSSSTTSADTSTDSSGPIDPTTGLPYADEGFGTGGGISGAGGWTGSGSAGGTGSGTGDTSAGASTDSGTTLAGEISDVTGLASALEAAGLVQAPGTGDTIIGPGSPAGLTTGQQKTLNSDLARLNKTIKKDTTTIGRLQKQVAKLTPRKTTKRGNHKNPGHTITHVGGARIVSSSAPHNARQHNNVAPPSHQRATHRPAPKPKPKPKPKHKKTRH